MAMADIAKHGNAVEGLGRAVSLSEISSRQQLSVAYLEQLFAKLRDAGLVASARGRHGGYKLARPAGDIAIVDILEAVDEPTRMTRCVGPADNGCIGDERCLTHELWSALGRHIRGFLVEVTLADVVSDDRALLARANFPVAVEGAERGARHHD